MNANTDTTCVEKGIWTPIPGPLPSDFTLDFGSVDPSEEERIKTSGEMSFHMVGCSGDFNDHTFQQNVANAMDAQLKDPATHVSFFFHLGDVVYNPDKKPGKADQKPKYEDMYNAQFYKPYTDYSRSIFAIAGNHDGKAEKPKSKLKTVPNAGPETAIQHFWLNFCAKERKPSSDNGTDQRPAMNQPYIYWRLDTPLAYIIGLYSNIANGGILDDPKDNPDPQQGPQYQWLVGQLKDVKAANESNMPRKAVLLAVHYPPYSGATNFDERGDPNPPFAPTPGAENARPLGNLLQAAFTASGQQPDAVFSAHAHLYQRLTYHHDGWEVPYLIAGCGGHYTEDPKHPLECMWKQCNGDPGPSRTLPLPAVMPKGLTLPNGDEVQVVAYNDQSFGFLRVTIESGKLTGEFFTADGGVPTLEDAFVLDMDTHTVKNMAIER